MADEIKVYKCCPFCKSNNITEKTLKFLPEMERFPVDYQQGNCLDCGKFWNNSW